MELESANSRSRRIASTSRRDFSRISPDMKTSIPPVLITFGLVCLGLMPKAQAVGPDTDGSIPGSNNGEGIGVLVSRTTGIWNTGTGFEALNHLTAGNQNTATGLRALFSDTNGGFNTAPAFIRSLATRAGFLTVPPALIRSLITRVAASTPPTVILHSISTPKASKTRPLVMLRSTKTPPARRNGYRFSCAQSQLTETSTMLLAVGRFLKILTLITTRPTVIERSKTTPPAPPTRPLASGHSLQHDRQQQHGQRCFALYSNTTGNNNTASGSSSAHEQHSTGNQHGQRC